MPRSSSFKLTGLKKVSANLDRVKVRGVDVANRVMRQEAKTALQRAQDDAPVDTGALRDSGKVTTTKGATGESIDISFGSADVDYALVVHEMPGPGKRFLANAVQETGRGLTGRLARKLSAALRRIVR